MLTDSHCHLASHKFGSEELDSIIENAKEYGVTQIITLATNLEDCPLNLAIAETYPEVFACAGIHPCDVHETPDDYLSGLRTFAEHPRCVAIGETGLDYYHPAPDEWTDEAYYTRQRDFLHQHFQLAQELGKNVVVHTRDRSGHQSLTDAIEIYKNYAEKVCAVFHCFPYGLDVAQPIFDLGGIISFTGIATFKNAQTVQESARNCSRGKFMLETDAPYLAPVPKRGTRNEPAYTKFTAEHIATIRGESLAELAAHTTATADDFYHLKK